MSSDKYKKIDTHSFESVWSRVVESTDIKYQSDLAEVVGVKQGAVSSRKTQDIWPEEWAYRIGKKYDLLTEWILTGKGPRRISDIQKNDKYEFETLNDLNQWLSEVVVKEPYRREWFKASIEDTFPMFKEWKKRREEKEDEDCNFSGSNVA